MTGTARSTFVLVRLVAALIVVLGLVASLPLTGPPTSWQSQPALAGDDDDDDEDDDDEGDDDGGDDDGDDNRGHGNDDDGEDEDNPGRGNRGNNQGNDDDQQEDVAPVEPFVIEIACAFDASADRTTCTFAGRGATDGLRDIGVPAAAICSTVVGGDYEQGGFAASAEVLTDGFSARSGRVELTLILEGELVQGEPVTYWVATDAATFPAEGPSLGCAAEPEPAATEVAETPPAVGAIEIWAYGCEAGQPLDPAVFDWYGRCQSPAAGATFRLSRRDGQTFVPIGEAVADADGLVRFPALEPGTYRVEEVDAVWCHAESNSVDERGEVVVVAGERATVWTFHCDEVAEPK